MLTIDAVLEGFLNSIHSLHELPAHERVRMRAADKKGRGCGEELQASQHGSGGGAALLAGIGAKIGRKGRHMVIAKVLEGGAAAASKAVFEGDIVEQVTGSFLCLHLCVCVCE